MYAAHRLEHLRLDAVLSLMPEQEGKLLIGFLKLLLGQIQPVLIAINVSF